MKNKIENTIDELRTQALDLMTVSSYLFEMKSMLQKEIDNQDGFIDHDKRLGVSTEWNEGKRAGLSRAYTLLIQTELFGSDGYFLKGRGGDEKNG